MTRVRVVWLLAVALLAGTWLASPGSVPLYDGIGFPDEPYRWVQPPPGAPATKPPTSAKVVVSVDGGTSRYADTNSGEFGPQVSLHLPDGSMTSDAGRITVRADPLAAAGPGPDGGTITGNGYRVSAPGAVFRAGHAATISLREPVLTEVFPRFVYRGSPSAAWRWLDTDRPGRDFFRAFVTGAGDYALAIPSGTPAPGRAGGGGSPPRRRLPVGGLLAGTVAAMVLVVVGLRIRNRRRA
ncbi:MAG: hypothetical protein JWO79_4482 [Actinomycetia bacterium]|nr:hypothetical protein [Actinomycetes bacterium]